MAFHHLYLKPAPAPLPSLPFSLWDTNVEPGSSLQFPVLHTAKGWWLLC